MGNKRKPLIGITSVLEEGRLKLKNEYISYVSGAGGIPFIIPAVNGLKNNIDEYVRSVDGLIIPGGRDIEPSYYGEKILHKVKVVPGEKTDFEIALVRGIIKAGKPLLGICYGMQLINVAMGGSLYQDIASQMPGALNHKKGAHVVYVEALFPSGPYAVGSSHHQAVKGLGEGLEVFARSKDGIIEGIYMKDYPFALGVEWHPERSMGDGISNKIISRFMGVASDCK
jgi:putative glutamine amidotransferase